MNKVVKHKGGETWWFGGRLIYNFGGILTHGTKRVTAASKLRDVNFGFENKVNIAKNHIDGTLGGISLEGKIASTPHGFIYADDANIKEYKKKHILHFRNILGDQTLTAEDITIEAKDMDDEGNVIKSNDLIQKAQGTVETEE